MCKQAWAYNQWSMITCDQDLEFEDEGMAGKIEAGQPFEGMVYSATEYGGIYAIDGIVDGRRVEVYCGDNGGSLKESHIHAARA